MTASEAAVAYSPGMERASQPATLSIPTTAKLLGVSERAVRTAIDLEQIEAVRIGRYIRVLRIPLFEMLGLPPDYEIPEPPEE